MKNLFLTSSFADSANLLVDWLKQADLPSKLLFIPTAVRVETYRGFIDQAYQRFAELGITANVLDIAEVSINEAKNVIAQTDVLAVSGGNTFYLLQELKRKQLIDWIRLRVEQGMFYAGESAGAMIASRAIDYVHLMDDNRFAPELADNTALGLVDFAIVPHFGEIPFVESTKQIVEQYQRQLTLIPINNRQAVQVQGNNYRILQ